MLIDKRVPDSALRNSGMVSSLLSVSQSGSAFSLHTVTRGESLFTVSEYMAAVPSNRNGIFPLGVLIQPTLKQWPQNDAFSDSSSAADALVARPTVDQILRYPDLSIPQPRMNRRVMSFQLVSVKRLKTNQPLHEPLTFCQRLSCSPAESPVEFNSSKKARQVCLATLPMCVLDSQSSVARCKYSSGSTPSLRGSSQALNPVAGLRGSRFSASKSSWLRSCLNKAASSVMGIPATTPILFNFLIVLPSNCPRDSGQACTKRGSGRDTMGRNGQSSPCPPSEQLSR